MSNLQNLKPVVRLAISSGEDGYNNQYGPGVAQLCQGVRELGSLNAAAKSMHMAYSKAWRIIKETEETFKIQLLNRDGAHGSTLTKDGDALLDAYLALESQLDRYAAREFAKKMAK